MRRLIALAGCVVGRGGTGGRCDGRCRRPEPTPEPTLVLEPNPVAPGARFTAILEGYCTGDEQNVFVDLVVQGGATVAECGGNSLAIGRLTAPSTPGDYDVRAEADFLLAVTQLVVQEGAPGPEDPLPETGPGSTVAVAVVGGGLLIAGIALFGVARTRRPSTP